MSERKFKLLDENATAPQRATQFSAGYDISASDTVTIEPDEIKLVHTGLAVDMYPDEVVLLFDRSSNPLKRGIRLANCVGVIDKDYFPNEFMGMFHNFTDEPVTIEKGQRIMQAVFSSFKTTIDDQPAETVRTGGLGSTGLGADLGHVIFDEVLPENDPDFKGIIVQSKE